MDYGEPPARTGVGSIHSSTQVECLKVEVFLIDVRKGIKSRKVHYYSFPSVLYLRRKPEYIARGRG